jgi:hypothetical protein
MWPGVQTINPIAIKSKRSEAPSIGIVSVIPDLAALTWHSLPFSGVKRMSKEQKSNKADKKKPVMSAKEKRAAKKTKKDDIKPFLTPDKAH